MAPKKWNFWDWALKAATPIAIGGALVWFGVTKTDYEQRMFTTVELRVDTEARTNSPIDEVSLSWQADTLSKRTDTTNQLLKKTILYQEKLDTLLTDQNALLDSIKSDNLKIKTQDSIAEIARAKSRNAREYKMDQILQKLNDTTQ